MATQVTLSDSNERVPKLRLTHDASFDLSPGRSINHRIDLAQYPEMVYGWCLSRVIHSAVRMRLAHPDKTLLAAKFDYSDAFRRLAHHGSAAAQSILVVDGVAYIYLRMTFGGSPNPPSWTNYSEMICDLVVNEELMECDEWDHKQLRSPQRRDYVTPPRIHGTGQPSPGCPLALTFPSSRTTSFADVFIDDIIHLVVDTGPTLRRAEQCAPLAVYTTNRPHAGDDFEPVPRRNFLGDEKLAAEGTFSDQQIILGWLFDFHRLEIKLPKDKLLVWTEDLKPILKSGSLTVETLESVVGRLNHSALLLPLGRHFLERPRRHLSGNYRTKKQRITLSPEAVRDLELWEKLLHRASRGVSMNLLVHRYPTQLSISDACPFGMGGFLLKSGFAWRLLIPTDSKLYGVDPSNNVLEFLAMAVNIWLLVLESRANKVSHECFLALGDNTSALGWVRRCSQLGADSWYRAPVNAIARHLALLLLDAQHLLFTQHIQGAHNVVADILSYSGKDRGKPNPLTVDSPPDDVLTQRFHSLIPQFIPQNFSISPLPNEILSWVTRTLRTLESSYIRSRNSPSKTKTAPGDAGSVFVEPTDSAITATSIQYQSKSETCWAEPSLSASDPLNSTTQGEWSESVQSRWSQGLSRIPLATLRRNFGTVTEGRPFISKERLLGPPASECS